MDMRICVVEMVQSPQRARDLASRGYKIFLFTPAEFLAHFKVSFHSCYERSECDGEKNPLLIVISALIFDRKLGNILSSSVGNKLLKIHNKFWRNVA